MDFKSFVSNRLYTKFPRFPAAFPGPNEKFADSGQNLQNLSITTKNSLPNSVRQGIGTARGNHATGSVLIAEHGSHSWEQPSLTNPFDAFDRSAQADL